MENSISSDSVKTSAKNKLASNIGWMFLLQIANLVFPLLTISIISRIIGPAHLGTINYAAAVVTYLTIIINYSFDMDGTRYVSQHREEYSKINRFFSDVLYTKIFLLVITLFVFVILFYFLPEFRKDYRVAFYSYLVCVGSVISPNFLFWGMQHFKAYSILNFIGKGIFTVMVLLMVTRKEDYVWQPLLLSLSQILVGLMGFYMAFRKYRVTLLIPSWQNIVLTLKNGRTVFLSFVTMNLYTTTSIVILGLFVRDSTQIGYYTAANRLILVAQGLIFTPINGTLFPYIGAAFGKSREEGIEIVKRILPVSLILSLVYSLGIFLFSPLIIHIMYGNEFSESVNMLRILSFLPFIINCSSLLGIQTMVNLKMDKEFFTVTKWGAIVGVPVNLLLAWLFGIWGTAIALIGIEVFICLFFYQMLHRSSIHVIDRQNMSWNYLKDSSSVYLGKFVKNIRDYTRNLKPR